MKHIISFIVMIGWMAGIVLANGFWSTLLALFVPFWAWYLIVEKLINSLL